MNMLNVGVFADKPFACTGFSVVCSQLSKELAKDFSWSKVAKKTMGVYQR